MMNKSSHIKINILIREFNSRITYITSFRFIIITTAGKHTSAAISDNIKIIKAKVCNKEFCIGIAGTCLLYTLYQL